MKLKTFNKNVFKAGCTVLLFSFGTAYAQFVQQGNKLIGTGAVDSAGQGGSVSISSDGNTAIVGGESDNNNAGATWVYIRSGGIWAQQGNKLVGTGAIGSYVGQGGSVAISSDGNTIIVGGAGDSSGTGAAWVYTRSGGIWTQQGNKLVGTGAVNGTYGSEQGSSVAISSDGNTAVVGGPGDSSNAGAVWVYTRASGVWTQQGNKLVGTGAVYGLYGAGQGSVAVSSDGNTIIVGGAEDNNQIGAVWIYTRSAGVWTQQGNKLVGTGVVGIFGSQQGGSVSLSADGNTALVGGPSDSVNTGAAWVYVRSGGVWTQQGNKLRGIGTIGRAEQGHSVSISSDGNTAIIGGYTDNSEVGAVWVYTRSGGVWTQQGSKLVGTSSVGESGEGVAVAISSDGSTAIVGGPFDNNTVGAAWVFTTASTTTDIENPVIGNNLFTVYPNPSAGVFTIDTKEKENEIIIMNVIGGKIYSSLITSDKTAIDLSNQPNGIYFVQLKSEQGISTEKIIIDK